MSKKHAGNILTETIETFAEAGKQISKDTARGVASIADINSFLYGPTPEDTPETLHKKTTRAVKEFGVNEQTKRENELMEQNSTPLDVQALRDKQQMAEIKSRLFTYQKGEEEKARRKIDEEKNAKQQEVQDEEKTRKRAQQEAAQAPADDEPHGKDKPRLGAPRKKASTDPHQNYEQKANKGK